MLVSSFLHSFNYTFQITCRLQLHSVLFCPRRFRLEKNDITKTLRTLRWPFRSWDENFTKILKISSLYSQSLSVVIHNTPVVESHPTREMRDLLWPRSTPTGNTVYFYMSSSFIYTLKIHRGSFKHSVLRKYYGK